MKKAIQVLLIALSCQIVWSQDGFYVTIPDDAYAPILSAQEDNESLILNFTSSEIGKFFDKYRITFFEKAFAKSKNPLLKDVYLIKTQDLALADDLLKSFPSKYSNIDYWEEPELLYEPNDFALDLSEQDGLELIRAKDAWEITKGSSNIIIGINDTYIETTHEDLEDKIEEVLANGSVDSHGVRVSFCAAGDTDNSTGLSSIGFNSRIKFKSALSVSNLYALAADGADIVNASWRSCTYSSTEQTAIDDIHGMGVIIVAGAGNGTRGASCGEDEHGYCYPASYEHVISVTSVAHSYPYGNIHPTYGAYGWEDCHEDSISNPTTVHTHNDSVDLCAPGYTVSTATLNDSYTSVWGTSFASPIVAGLCALILSENPSLTPDEVESILKSTAFDVTTLSANSAFNGLLGAGRINAYAAVNAARETNVTYASIPYSTGFESGLDENWTMYESHRFGRCVRSSDHSPKTGSYHLTMDVIKNGNYNTNEAWMHLNLSGMSDVELEFWWKETSDETHTADGVFISDDGGDSFTKIYNLSGGSSTYSKVTIDLSYEISDASLSHSSTFVVKFQQYDNYTMTIDGIAIDDINVCAKPATPIAIIPPSTPCTNEWEEYWCPLNPYDAIEYDWYSPSMTLTEDGSNYVDSYAWTEGYHTLQVRSKNVCGQYSDWKSSSIWIEDCYWRGESGDNMFILHPNPANYYVTVSLNKDLAKESEITNQGFTVNVFNQYGNLVISEETKGDVIRITTNHLPNGSYVFRIAYQGKFYSYEVIVQH